MNADFCSVSDIIINVRGHSLPVQLRIPKDPCCTVIFAFVSGSKSRRSVAAMKEFNRNGIATVSLDLLTEDEKNSRNIALDTQMLTERLIAVFGWARKRKEIHDLSMGSFSTSAGTASALKSSIIKDLNLQAIVSVDGRPDLAWDVLEKVRIPTLLMVGSRNYGLLELNESSYDRMKCIKRMEIVPEAQDTYYESPGYQKVAEHARNWFLNNMRIEKVENFI